MTRAARYAALAAVLAAATLALPASAALKEGDTAPDFQAPAALAGKAYTFELKQALKKGPVVVYFYPAAFTNGCSLQAHTFAVNAEQFAAANATVIGLSLDTPEQLREFSADPQTCAGKVPVASDTDGRIARAFDIGVSAPVAGRKNNRGQEITHGRAERTTFVVAPNGKVGATIGGVAPEENVLQALAAVRKISSTSKP
ncbi:peroxiredoxin [Piscinibacter sp. HJYY11]|uniref:peroxiredoxin n=1 Tax=Piscinibacter sp. HJYY11 TaxID=2801333 RepID=UPI00191E4579|nr:redoxin domain-containing protein [Piscinibacter sp. HJYY11]MBL0728573.1 redoxin domain-containing protein [Piscinibacter sp. HJYY11]